MQLVPMQVKIFFFFYFLFYFFFSFFIFYFLFFSQGVLASQVIMSKAKTVSTPVFTESQSDYVETNFFLNKFYQLKNSSNNPIFTNPKLLSGSNVYNPNFYVVIFFFFFSFFSYFLFIFYFTE